MNSRGSGFFDFAYTTLILANVLVALLFFAIPSTPMTIWSAAMSVFLTINLFIVLGVPQIRKEEGWVGITSVSWATLMSLYLIGQTRAVDWGKREEEERLTGREEPRRSLMELIAVLVQTIIMVVMILVAILLMASLILRSRDVTLAAPGKKYYVDGDKYQVHLHCVGAMSNPSPYPNSPKHPPTVLIEAGEKPAEDSLLGWIDSSYRNGTIDRYCYWDRPGVAWSDNAPSPHSAGMSADALFDALIAAGEVNPQNNGHSNLHQPPGFIIVSAGIGTLSARIFAARHAPNIHGLMLIDGLHEAYLSSLGSISRKLGLFVHSMLAPLGLNRLTGAIFRGQSREDRVYGHQADKSGKFLLAELQNALAAKSMTRGEITRARSTQERGMPLVVIASGVESRRHDGWADKQRELASVTDNLVAWDEVSGAPHEIWTDVVGFRVCEKRLQDLVKAAPRTRWSTGIRESD